MLNCEKSAIRTIALETFKIINKKSPLFIQNLVIIKNNSHNFRYRNTAEVPRPRTSNYGKRSFRYEAAPEMFATAFCFCLYMHVLFLFQCCLCLNVLPFYLCAFVFCALLLYMILNTLPDHCRRENGFSQFRSLIQSWDGSRCHSSTCIVFSISF